MATIGENINHVKQQVRCLMHVAFFVPCAKRVQKLRCENKKSAQAEAQAQKLPCDADIAAHVVGILELQQQ